VEFPSRVKKAASPRCTHAVDVLLHVLRGIWDIRYGTSRNIVAKVSDTLL